GDRRTAGGEAIDYEPRRGFEEARVGDDGLKFDRVGSRALRAELRVARLEMRGPDPVGVRRRRERPLHVQMRQAGENFQLVDAIPPRILIPGDGAGRLVDEE